MSAPTRGVHRDDGANGSGAPGSASRSEPHDRVAGMLLGTDDYLGAKPFRWGKLVARLRNLMRRSGSGQASVSRRLTPRELEIRRSPGEGRLPYEIVGQPFISPKTVVIHSENILRKLGVRSRARGPSPSPTARNPAALGGDRRTALAVAADDRAGEAQAGERLDGDRGRVRRASHAGRGAPRETVAAASRPRHVSRCRCRRCSGRGPARG